MRKQMNPSPGTSISAYPDRGRPPAQLLAPHELDDPSVSPVVVSEGRKGLLQQFASLAQSLLPGQVARLTVTTLEIFGGSNSSAPPAPKIQPIGRQTVLRVLERAYWTGELGTCKWHHAPEIHQKWDGTTVVVFLDGFTGFKIAWTVCPITHKPKELGYVND